MAAQSTAQTSREAIPKNVGEKCEKAYKAMYRFERENPKANGLSSLDLLEILRRDDTDDRDGGDVSARLTDLSKAGLIRITESRITKNSKSSKRRQCWITTTCTSSRYRCKSVAQHASQSSE